MAYRDILLAIVSYPDATPLGAIDAAVRIARRLGGQVTALGVQIHTETPANVMAETLAAVETVAAAELAKSSASIEAALARFQADDHTIGLTAFTTVGLSHVYDEGAVVVSEARTHDLCLVPIGPTTQSDQIIAEQLLFESGRPICAAVPQAAPSDGQTGPYQHIAIAWDGSRPAARAIGDAMPLLAQAHDVRLLTVVNEKPSAPPASPASSCVISASTACAVRWMRSTSPAARFGRVRDLCPHARDRTSGDGRVRPFANPRTAAGWSDRGRAGQTDRPRLDVPLTWRRRRRLS